MALFILRMTNGNCVVAAAANESAARSRACDLVDEHEIASIRVLACFAAQFTLSDEGELKSILLDPGTVSDLHQHEYPMLHAARRQSYEDFGPLPAASGSQPVMYSTDVREDRREWDRRDTDLISYAVQQERERLAN